MELIYPLRIHLKFVEILILHFLEQIGDSSFMAFSRITHDINSREFISLIKQSHCTRLTDLVGVIHLKKCLGDHVAQ